MISSSSQYDNVDLTMIDRVDYVWNEAAESEDENDDDYDVGRGNGIDVHDPNIEVGIDVDGTPLRMITNRPVRVLSKRAVLRKFLAGSCGFGEIIRTTKYLCDDSLLAFVTALIEIVEGSNPTPDSRELEGEGGRDFNGGVEPSYDEYVLGGSLRTASDLVKGSNRVWMGYPTNMGSVAWAEVIMAEVAVRNKGRLRGGVLGKVWGHYKRGMREVGRGTFVGVKRTWGVLRIAGKLVGVEEVKEEVFELLGCLDPVTKEAGEVLCPMVLEGMLRIFQENIMEFSTLRPSVFSCWCKVVTNNISLVTGDVGFTGGLEEVWGTLLKAHRLCFLLVHSKETGKACPGGAMAGPIGALVEVAGGVDGRGGEGGGTEEEWDFRSRIAIAGLDMLAVVQSRVDMGVREDMREVWNGVNVRFEVVAKYGSMTAVRQHAITLLLEAVVDKGAKGLGGEAIKAAVWGCAGVGKERLENILGMEIEEDLRSCQEDVKAEVELAVLVVFKGFLAHVEELGDAGGVEEIWVKVLEVAEVVLTKVGEERNEEWINFHSGGIEMCVEQLRNVLNVMEGVGAFGDDGGGGIRKVTEESLERMELGGRDIMGFFEMQSEGGQGGVEQ